MLLWNLACLKYRRCASIAPLTASKNSNFFFASMLERAVICNSSSTKSLTNRGQMIFPQTLVQTHTNYNWHDNFQHDSNTTQACALNMLGLDTLPPLKVWKCHISWGGMTAGAQGETHQIEPSLLKLGLCIPQILCFKEDRRNMGNKSRSNKWQV